MLTKEQNQLLADWHSTRLELAAIKEKEMELRKKIVFEGNIFDPKKEKGTEGIDIGNGYRLKVVKSISYKVDNKDNKAFNILAKAAAVSEIDAFLVKDLMRFDAHIRTEPYDKLSPEARKIIDSIVETSAGAPKLDIVAPKEEV